MTYTPSNEATFFQHYEDTETTEKSKGAKIERYMDDLDKIINDIVEKWALVEVADISALRDLYDDANWDNSDTQHITVDNQIRKVLSASDGTNTFMALYWFDESASDTDADGASGNVDTDGIVEPTSGRATGRWKRIAAVGTDGTGAYVHRDGIEALRTMVKYLYVNLTSGSSDVAIKTNKRTAGSQVKWTTDAEIALRNIADSAYADLAIKALTGTGNFTTSGDISTSGSGNISSAGNVSATGNVSGVDGTFTGNVSGVQGDFTGSGSFGGNLDMNSNQIKEVSAATAGTDAPNLDQVNSLIASSAPLWGDGSDGDLTTSGDVTLTAPAYYDNLTVSSGDTINLNGYPLYVRGTLTWDGTINAGKGADGANGANGASGGGSSAGGAGGTNTRGYFPVLNGVAGANGPSGTTGTAGTAGNNVVNTVNSPGTAVAGGAAGDSENGPPVYSGGAGGAAGTASGIGIKFRDIVSLVGYMFANSDGIFNAAGSGAGGSGGGSHDPGTGGAGGGSGAAGQTALIVASVITYGASSTLTGLGGDGGDGGDGYNGSKDSGGGGGGSGGPGSLVFAVTASKTGSLNTTTLTGGAAGSGGTSVAGTNGSAGSAGPTGVFVEIDI